MIASLSSPLPTSGTTKFKNQQAQYGPATGITEMPNHDPHLETDHPPPRPGAGSAGGGHFYFGVFGHFHFGVHIFHESGPRNWT